MKTMNLALAVVLTVLLVTPASAEHHSSAEFDRRLKALLQDLSEPPEHPSYPISTKLEGPDGIFLKPIALTDLAEGLKSRRPSSHEQVYISLTNNTHESQTVSWINFDGKRVVYKHELKPGQTFRHRSFTGHCWLLESPSGRDTALFRIVQAIETRIERSGFSYERLPLDTASLKSQSSPGGVVKVVIINNTPVAQTVSWIDYQGKRRVLDTVKPGAESNRHTYPTHVFLIENAATGKDTALLRLRKH